MSANRFMSGTSANGKGATRHPARDRARGAQARPAASVIVRDMTTTATMADARFRDAQRLFQHDAAALRDLGPTLETTVTPPEPPRVVQSDVIESTTVRAHRIADPPGVGFDAFLDGAQESKVIHYADGVPIVFGRVAAVVRQRVLRRMVTWKRPLCRSRLYIPRDLVPPTLWMRVVDAGFEVVDTTDARGRTPAGRPKTHTRSSLAQRALDAVKRDRERAERQLAEEWCATQEEPLFIDGSIATSNRVAAAPNAIGVIKSHRTLYVAGAGHARRAVTAAEPSLECDSRRGLSPHVGRELVLADSRLRRSGSNVGAAARGERHAGQRRVAASDRRSREPRSRAGFWPELMPLSLPDSRWDKMVYGIRDCEEFLRSATAIKGSDRFQGLPCPLESAQCGRTVRAIVFPSLPLDAVDLPQPQRLPS